MKEGACPHLQLALCCSFQRRIWTRSLTATVRQSSPERHSESRTQQEAMCFLGAASLSINYVSSRAICSGRVLLWTATEGSGPFIKLQGPRNLPPLGASWSQWHLPCGNTFPTVHVLVVTHEITPCSYTLQITELHYEEPQWHGENRRNES